jgi:hypothetical protein
MRKLPGAGAGPDCGEHRQATGVWDASYTPAVKREGMGLAAVREAVIVALACFLFLIYGPCFNHSICAAMRGEGRA